METKEEIPDEIYGLILGHAIELRNSPYDAHDRVIEKKENLCVLYNSFTLVSTRFYKIVHTLLLPSITSCCSITDYKSLVHLPGLTSLMLDKRAGHHALTSAFSKTWPRVTDISLMSFDQYQALESIEEHLATSLRRLALCWVPPDVPIRLHNLTRLECLSLIGDAAFGRHARFLITLPDSLQSLSVNTGFVYNEGAIDLIRPEAIMALTRLTNLRLSERTFFMERAVPHMSNLTALSLRSGTLGPVLLPFNPGRLRKLAISCGLPYSDDHNEEQDLAHDTLRRLVSLESLRISSAPSQYLLDGLPCLAANLTSLYIYFARERDLGFLLKLRRLTKLTLQYDFWGDDALLRDVAVPDSLAYLDINIERHVKSPSFTIFTIRRDQRYEMAFTDEQPRRVLRFDATDAIKDMERVEQYHEVFVC